MSAASETPVRRKKQSGFGATWIAAAMVLGLAAYVYFVEYEGGKRKDEQKKKDEIVLRFEATKAEKIDIVAGDRLIALEKKAEVWRLAKPIAEAADDAAVNALIGTLSGERFQEVVVEGPQVDWAKYGLATPTGKVSVRTADGTQYQVEIGAKSFDASLYARVTGENRVLLVSPAWDPVLAKQPNDLRDKRLYRSELHEKDEIDALEIASTDAAGKRAVVSLVKKEGKWTFATPAPLPISQDAVDAYLRTARGLRASEFVAEEKMDAAILRRVGLAQPHLVVTFKQGGKPTWTASFARAASPKPVAGQQARPMAAEVAAISDDVPAIVNVASSAVQSLEKTRASFFDRAAPFRFAVIEAAEVSIQTPQLVIEAKKVGPDWIPTDATKVSLGGRELDSPKLQATIVKLSSMKADEFLGDEKPVGLKPAKNRIVVRDSAGKVLIDFVWGDVFRRKAVAKHPAHSPEDDEMGLHAAPDQGAERSLHFVETRAGGVGFPVFGASVSAVDGLGLGEIAREKAKAPAPAATPETKSP